MKAASKPKLTADGIHSQSVELTNVPQRSARRSHASTSSYKRPSMNGAHTNSSKIKQGMFRQAVPQMPRALACFCFVLNLILPGTGRKRFQFFARLGRRKSCREAENDWWMTFTWHVSSLNSTRRVSLPLDDWRTCMCPARNQSIYLLLLFRLCWEIFIRLDCLLLLLSSLLLLLWLFSLHIPLFLSRAHGRSMFPNLYFAPNSLHQTCCWHDFPLSPLINSCDVKNKTRRRRKKKRNGRTPLLALNGKAMINDSIFLLITHGSTAVHCLSLFRAASQQNSFGSLVCHILVQWSNVAD